MFTINNITKNNGSQDYIELINADKTTLSKISLSLGGSLQQLKLNNKLIIDSFSMDYYTSYASSILFPFVNRIKNGKYAFEGKMYTLTCNAKEENNALHGLVYDKTFTCICKENGNDFCSVTLAYNSKEDNVGFPFMYSIYLTYTLSTNKLKLKVVVKNNDVCSFPFAIGWHPYFISSNLAESFLGVNKAKKVVLDDNLLLIDEEESIPIDTPIQFKEKRFDDCLAMENNQIHFKTPDYTIDFNSSNPTNYVQIYTPQQTNSIALELMTGIPNSFNNQVGLQVLGSDEMYEINWEINLKN